MFTLETQKKNVRGGAFNKTEAEVFGTERAGTTPHIILENTMPQMKHDGVSIMLREDG